MHKNNISLTISKNKFNDKLQLKLQQRVVC